MALKDLSYDELKALTAQWFAESKISEWGDLEEVSVMQIKQALNADYDLIRKISADTKSFIGEIIAENIAGRGGVSGIRDNIIEASETGQLELNSLRIVDKNGVVRIIPMQTRAKTIARTELFRNLENDKMQSAQSALSDPVGIAKAVLDKTTRSTHSLWNDWAMRLDDWARAKDRPGKKPNCRCTLKIMESRKYNGTIHEGLPF
jgi:hypothetical protein